MAARSQQSSSRPEHPNEPRADAQREPKSSGPSSTITAERKRYLAKQYGYTEEQIEVLRVQICPTASDAELEFFLATCRRVKLDPFARQIYFIKRKQRVENDWGEASWVEVGRPETSIDGLRASAEQTGEYEGQAPTEWCDRDGIWVPVWLAKDPPAAARSTIFRKALREPMVTVAVFDEFCPRFKGKSDVAEKMPQMWRKMPANQIAKCAEALGFRRAFPRDLSGLYIGEELEHTSYGANETAAPAAAPASKGKVIDAASSETKALPPPSASSLLELVAKATTRAELAPVGRALTELGKRRDDDSASAVIAEVKPKMEEKWRTLPPAGARA